MANPHLESGPQDTTTGVSSPGGIVFVFPGVGSHGAGAAIELVASAPAFADEMQACDAAFSEFADWSLREAVRGGTSAPRLDGIDVIEPVVFAVSVSLAAQWRAQGVQPDAVLGHAQGEIAAAYVAGALSLRDAALVVTVRSRAIHAAGRGTASNSPEVEELRTALREGLSELQPRNTLTAFISTVTGARLDSSILDSDYWFANLWQPVLFAEAIRWSYDHGYRMFIESSPHPVLSADVQEIVGIDSCDHMAVGSRPSTPANEFGTKGPHTWS